MEPFSLDNFELPNAARSLCEEAMDVAKKLLNGLDHVKAEKIARAYFKEMLNHVMDKGIENFQHLPPELFSLFNYPTDIDGLEKLLEKIHVDKNDQTSKLTQPLDDEDENDQDMNIVVAFALLNQISTIKSVEDALLAESNKPDYKEFMAYLDTTMHNLSKFLNFAKSLAPGKEYLKTKILRQKGAIKGAAAKAKKYEKLKSRVLKDFETSYSSSKATIAAEKIFENIGYNSELIFDEEGKLLTTDPISLFTTWIRKHRSMK